MYDILIGFLTELKHEGKDFKDRIFGDAYVLFQREISKEVGLTVPGSFV